MPKFAYYIRHTLQKEIGVDHLTVMSTRPVQNLANRLNYAVDFPTSGKHIKCGNKLHITCQYISLAYFCSCI
jgi:hypothetical protein